MADDKAILETYQAELPVRLTPEQTADRARMACVIQGEIKAVQERKKRQIAEADAELKRLRAELDSYAQIAREEAELKPVPVYVVADFILNVANHVRADTLETLPARTRPLRLEERQVRLFDGAGVGRTPIAPVPTEEDAADDSTALQ